MQRKEIRGRIVLTACIAVVLALTGSGLRENTELSDTSPFNDDDRLFCLRDIYDLEDLFVFHQYSFLPVAPPAVDFYWFQPYGPPVPFLWESFPSRFNEKLIPEWAFENIPTYTVYIYEDPKTREIVFLNSRWETLYSLPPLPDYNPFAWILDWKPGLTEGKYTEEEINWLLGIYNPARVQGVFTLIPSECYADYLEYKQEALKKATEGLAGGGVIKSMRSGSFGSNDLWLSIRSAGQGYTNGAEITVHLPDDFTNAVELYTSADLYSGTWEMEATNLTAEGTNIIVYEDEDVGNVVYLTYLAGNAGMDSDADGLSDPSEIKVYGTDKNDSDSDDDNLSDGDEVNVYGADPLDPDTDDDGVGDNYDPNKTVFDNFLMVLHPAENTRTVW